MMAATGDTCTADTDLPDGWINIKDVLLHFHKKAIPDNDEEIEKIASYVANNEGKFSSLWSLYFGIYTLCKKDGRSSPSSGRKLMESVVQSLNNKIHGETDEHNSGLLCPKQVANFWKCLCEICTRHDSTFCKVSVSAPVEKTLAKHAKMCNLPADWGCLKTLGFCNIPLCNDEKDFGHVCGVVRALNEECKQFHTLRDNVHRRIRDMNQSDEGRRVLDKNKVIMLNDASIRKEVNRKVAALVVFFFFVPNLLLWLHAFFRILDCEEDGYSQIAWMLTLGFFLQFATVITSLCTRVAWLVCDKTCRLCGRSCSSSLLGDVGAMVTFQLICYAPIVLMVGCPLRAYGVCNDEKWVAWGTVIASVVGPFAGCISAGVHLIQAKANTRLTCCKTRCNWCAYICCKQTPCSFEDVDAKDFVGVDAFASDPIGVPTDDNSSAKSSDEIWISRIRQLECVDRLHSWYNAAKTFSSNCAGALVIQTLLTATFNGALVDDVGATQILVLSSIAYFGTLKIIISIADVRDSKQQEQLASYKDQIRNFPGTTVERGFAHGRQNFGGEYWVSVTNT